MTARLSRRGLGALASLPADPPAVAGIVHLGLGSFHRAHQALYTARALELEPGPWAIVGVSRRSRGVVAAMRAQDGLYSVLELAPDAGAAAVIGVHRELLVAADDPGAVVARIADAATRIVTLTVTERGYSARS
ncbi:MAG: fructuronate reductase, partial [Solirubrobacteraceae bacterium]|nr:fructuronate reductase [Solirubrobacteraceae bacterium]